MQFESFSWLLPLVALLAAGLFAGFCAGMFGIGGGFVVGLGILYLLAAGDKSLHTERDVELALKLPVLATVPTLQVLGNRAVLAPGILDADRHHEPTHASA